MAVASSDIAWTWPKATWRVTQLGAADGEGVGDGDGVGDGVADDEGLGAGTGLTTTGGVVLRSAWSRTMRNVTASPPASATNARLASTGCNQRMVRCLASQT